MKKKAGNEKQSKSSAKKNVAVEIISSIGEDIKDSNIYKLVISSFRAWYRNWPLVLLSVLVDFLFLVALASVIWFVMPHILVSLEKVMTMAGEATGGLMNIYNQTADVSSGLVTTYQSADFNYHLGLILKYIAFLLLIAIPLIWMFFQGISWYLAHMMATKKGKRQNFFRYWLNFIIESIPFYLFFVLMVLVTTRAIISIRMSLVPAGESLVNFIFLILVIATFYFAFLSFSLTGRNGFSNLKQCFVYGATRFLKTIQSFAAIIVILWVINLILNIPFIANDAFLIMVFGTILVMPTIVYGRILLFKTTQAYWKK